MKSSHTEITSLILSVLSSSTLLDQALKIYKDQPHLAPEHARTSFKKGIVLLSSQGRAQAKPWLEDAVELRTEWLGKIGKLETEREANKNLGDLMGLNEEDFNDLVVFWTR